MPDLLAPTNPVPNTPQPVRVTVPPPTDTTVQNIVDPSRVTRSDQRTDQDTRDATGAARYESNFMTFLQRLRNAQDLPDNFMKVLQWSERQVASGIRAGFAEELASLMAFLRMDEAELLEFLKNQLQSGSRFTGELFQALRDAYKGADSELVRGEILNFLKKYSDFSSTDHLEGKLLRTTEEMAQSVPSKWGNQVMELLNQLKNGVAAGDRQGNLNLLKGKLFPLISNYVTQTHDHGRARGLLSMLSLDVARYENGGEEGLLSAMRHLSTAGLLPREYAGLSDEQLLQMLRDGQFAQAARNNQFADRMAEMMNQALKGQGGVDAQEAFHNIMTAALINESVYMPLSHIMIPLDWNGRKAFSELWLNPDADNGQGPGQTGARLLVKLDIQDVGAFDLLFLTRGTNVALQVSCPKEFTDFTEPIAQGLYTILSRNGLNPETVSVVEMRRPVMVSEVFPEIVQKMSGVNVRA